MSDTMSAGDTGRLNALKLCDDPDHAVGAHRGGSHRGVGRGGRRPLAALDDAALVALVQRGSQTAWDELVRRFSGLVAAVARSHRMSVDDAADVAQVTWLQLYRYVGGLRQPERIAGWLATTARRECRRVIAGRQEPVRSPTDHGLLSPDPGPEDTLLAGERREAVGRALDRMPDRSRRLLQLLMWDERSYEDISTEMDMPIGAIGPTRARALQRLARQPEVTGLESVRPGAA
jgi:RNA polymerase sigma factor (sigma-70 family)